MNWFSDVVIVREIIRPLLDILFLAVIIYKTYSILEETRAIQLIRGAVIILFIYAIAYFLNLSTLLWILRMLAPGIVIGLAIVFQPELRKIFTSIGQGEIFSLQSRSKPFLIESVISAVEILSKMKRGALIIFSRKVGLKHITDTGTKINADLSTNLITTVFSHDTALHDGAIIISNGKIVAAGCFLPLSNEPDLLKSLGTRHRAGLGMASESDAVVLILSEETGAKSLAYDGTIFYDLETDEIRKELKKLLQLSEDISEEPSS
ncbi:MAG: diadenylate cyclase CdaA [Spirochaetaceae bacterium]|jgi:diadenylate cyclase|nr:diadenylate cyclase CdaA [Spirochaetaceae bacterium]